MRKYLPVLLVLFCFGCADKRPTVPLTTVEVDPAAACPSQEPGTRPPVLTATPPLSKEELDEGLVRLFDGVSTYGWVVLDGNVEPAVRNWNGTPVLVVLREDKAPFSLTHRFAQAGIFRDNSADPHYPTMDIGGSYLAGQHLGVTKYTEYRNPPGMVGVCAKSVAKRPDMKTLGESDWKQPGGETKVSWEDGVLELTGGPGMIESADEYDNFVLQLEYFTEPGVNSGVFFRCIPGETLNGYECQIFNNPPAEDYEKFIGTDTGGIFRRCVGRNVGPEDNRWNYLTVAARGSMISTWVNGIQTVDWVDPREPNENPRRGLRLKQGTIQLQGHDPGTKIKFRNIKIARIL